MQRRDNIKRQGLQLEAHVKRHQVACRNHHHHADNAERNQDRVLKLQDTQLGHVIPAHQQDRRSAQQDHNFCETRKTVIDEHSAKGHVDARAGQSDPDRQGCEHCRGQPCQKRRAFVFGGVDPENQRSHGKDRQCDLGQNNCDISPDHISGPLLQAGSAARTRPRQVGIRRQGSQRSARSHRARARDRRRGKW